MSDTFRICSWLFFFGGELKSIRGDSAPRRGVRKPDESFFCLSSSSSAILRCNTFMRISMSSFSRSRSDP